MDIKIKNDTDETVQCTMPKWWNLFSTKGATTTIKMEEGDKLYISGKKGKKKRKITLEGIGSDMNGKTT